MKADLHVHSTASDGTCTPSELVSRASEAGLDILAVADHDSVGGIAEAEAASSAARLTVVPAVELSATSSCGHDVHILGYFIDYLDPVLIAALTRLREARFRRAEAMVIELTRGGYPIDLADVVHLSAGGSVGRSHVARTLVDAGHASSVAHAFQELIGRDRPFYVAKAAETTCQAIETVHRAGGLAFVAHPGVTRVDAILPSLVSEGLDGIEAFHADHTDAQREHYRAIASAEGLLTSGGSDYHGPQANNAALGSVDVPPESISALLAASERYR